MDTAAADQNRLSGQSSRVWLGPTTHLLAGMLPLSLATAYGFYTPSLGSVLLVMFLSLAPDLDSGASVLGRRLTFISEPLERRYGHRTITHSLLAVCAIALVTYAILPGSWVWLTAAYASHLVLDMIIGASGIPLFWPGQTHFHFAEVEPGGGGELAATVILAIAVIVPQLWRPIIPYLQDTSFEDALIQYQEHDGFYRSYAQIEGTITDSHIHIEGRFQIESLEGATFTMTCIESSPCEYLPYHFTAGKTGHEDIRVMHIELSQGEQYTGATLTHTPTLTYTPTLTPTPTPLPTETPTLNFSAAISWAVYQRALIVEQDQCRNPTRRSCKLAKADTAIAFSQWCEESQASECVAPALTALHATATPQPLFSPTPPLPDCYYIGADYPCVLQTTPKSKP